MQGSWLGTPTHRGFFALGLTAREWDHRTTPVKACQMARSRKPAEGERAAIGGYYPQYLMSSNLVLRRLDEGRLEWVRLANPEAGRLDDFQIGTDLMKT